jgi:uncharacterized repeat protein (TIGR03803 family)
VLLSVSCRQGLQGKQSRTALYFRVSFERRRDMTRSWFWAIIIVLASASAVGQATEKLLYSFGPPPDAEYGGASPLVSDHAGNLYGVATGGGSQNGGAVFELSPNGDGTWSETLVYSFCLYTQNCPDGASPVGLTIDSAGNLFGATAAGGSLSTYGSGVVFELSPSSAPGGAWTYSVIYKFCSVSFCFDGEFPYAPPTLDESGNLYGTTFEGGQIGSGIVYELSPNASGWNETVLDSFCPLSDCGSNPATGVAFDKMGNLYGTTTYGGAKVGKLGGGGTLFELSPGSNGWTETTLASFPRLGESKSVFGQPSLDPLGDVYTTFSVPDVFDGAVVRVKRDGTTKVFHFNGSDGNTPIAGVIVDPKLRMVYGTVEYSDSDRCGAVFRINASGQESLLYDFCQYTGDAATPGGLLEDASGNLYGLAQGGGAYGYGAVFEITP